MFKKLINSLTGKNKKEETKPNVEIQPETQPVEPEIDFSRIIRASETSMNISDYDGVLEQLPENVFDGHENIEYLRISSPNISEMPTSFSKLKKLKNLELHNKNLKSLPDFIFGLKQLESINLGLPKLKVDKHFLRLKELKTLEYLTLGGFYGTKFPTVIKELNQLKKLNIQAYRKKINQIQMMEELGQMKFLEHLQLDLDLDINQIGEKITGLDGIDRIRLWARHSTGKELIWGLFRKTRFIEHDTQRNAFIELMKDENDLSDKQRKILYGIFVDNFFAIKELMPNAILENQKQEKPIQLFFSYKPSRKLTASLKNIADQTNFRIEKEATANSIYIVNESSDYLKILEWVKAGGAIALEDHIKEWVTAIEDPWLLQEEAEAPNEQVLRLLASNQAENYLIAFQIISGGGANEELLSMIAAIWLSHPDKKVAREAEKLFNQLGPSTSYTYIKNSKISLRRSGTTLKKINRLFSADIGILSIPFRLMHNIIAGENPVIKDIQVGTISFKKFEFKEPIPSCIQYFEKITKLDFTHSKNLDAESLFKYISKLDNLSFLTLKGCKVIVPAQVAELKNIQTLELSSNQLENPEALGELKKLHSLAIEGCNIQSWKWLKELPLLSYLYIGRNKLKSIPDEVFSMSSLYYLHLNNNQLTEIDERISGIEQLVQLDLSGNKIVEIDYNIFTLRHLHSLFLRSNKIEELSDEKIMEVTNGNGCRNLTEFKINGNQLKEFKATRSLFPKLAILDISKNNLTELHDGIFTYCSIQQLNASDNAITHIPNSIANKYIRDLNLSKNLIEEMTVALSQASINTLDLRQNKIKEVPMSFASKGEGDFSRLYWKLDRHLMGWRFRK